MVTTCRQGCLEQHYLNSRSDGTTWGDLRDELPEIVRAEAMAKAKIACELIYKRRATLNGKRSPKTRLRPLALLCLLTPSLTSPCYMSPPSNATVLVASSIKNVSKAGAVVQMWGVLESVVQRHSGTVR